MALHVYQLWIEYDERPGYHPVNVYIKRGTGNQAEELPAQEHGKTLKPLLRRAIDVVVNEEREDGMIA